MEHKNILGQQHEELTDEKMLEMLTAQYATLHANGVVDFKAIGALSREIDRVKTRIDKAAKKRGSQGGVSDEDFDMAIGEIKTAMRAELKRRNYYYVTKGERFWLKTKENEWIPVSERALMRDIKGADRAVERNVLYDVMKEDARWFDKATFTFDKVDSNTLNMLEKDFAEIQDGEAHWLFDMVIRSICGEKADNIEHVEKLILTKYLHPETVTIPALLLQDRGGTGKGLMIEYMFPAIFGELGVGTNMRVEHVTSKFNSVGQGKAVWFLNEASRGGYSHSALKALVGSKTYAVEHKGTDAIIGPMTAWIVMSTQDIDGAVVLEGGGADRRWSVVRGKRELAAIVGEERGMSVDQVSEWIENEGKFIVSDRVEVGRWLRTLIERHGDCQISRGHHGEDYHATRQIQRPIEVLLFEAVFEEDGFEMIKTSTMYDLYERTVKQASRTPMGRGKFRALAERYILESHPDWHGISSVNHLSADGKRSKIDVFTRDQVQGTVQSNNDEHYRTVDDYGRVTWLIDIG